MKKLILTILLACITNSYADTLGKYASIANGIPPMQLKADEKSQAWARSAISILAVTDETIAQTILAMNELAKKSDQPIICPSASTGIDGDTIHALLKEIMLKMNTEDAQRNISEVVAKQLAVKYPCKNSQEAKFPAVAFQEHYQMQNVTR